MVTFRQLRAARPAAWRDAAAGWRALAASLAARAESIDRLRAELSAGWRGNAAGAAVAALTDQAGALRAARSPALHCDQALCEHADEIERLQRHLDAVVTAPGSALVTVTDDGAVELSRTAVRPDPFDEGVARRTTATIAEVLRAAQASDGRAADRLTTAAREFDATGRPAGVAGSTAVAGPPDGSTPTAVRRWWDGLSPTEQGWLLAHRPGVVGGLDGVPVAVRDTANRLLLDQLLAVPTDRAKARALAALADRLARSEPTRAYLISLDVTGDGRAVVALGDPDRASHVLTHVPGAGTDLGDLPGLLARTDRLDRAADGGGSVSTVLWLGYDAPEWLSATGTPAARRGAQDLDRFAEGLRAGALGPPAHHTIVAHSYGSLVVGVAARDHRLPVDDVVFVGSPGVGVDHAAELGLPAGHVWASTARFDLVRAAALADRRVEWFDGDVGADRWHGADPGHPAFGGRSFPSDPGSWHSPVTAHNAYFDDGTASLAAIGAVARGDYAAVR